MVIQWQYGLYSSPGDGCKIAGRNNGLIKDPTHTRHISCLTDMKQKNPQVSGWHQAFSVLILSCKK